MFLQPLLVPTPAPLTFATIDHPGRKLLIKGWILLRIYGTHTHTHTLQSLFYVKIYVFRFLVSKFIVSTKVKIVSTNARSVRAKGDLQCWSCLIAVRHNYGEQFVSVTGLVWHTTPSTSSFQHFVPFWHVINIGCLHCYSCHYRSVFYLASSFTALHQYCYTTHSATT